MPKTKPFHIGCDYHDCKKDATTYCISPQANYCSEHVNICERCGTTMVHHHNDPLAGVTWHNCPNHCLKFGNTNSRGVTTNPPKRYKDVVY